MSKNSYIFLKGLSAPVDITGCLELLDMLPEIAPLWPYEVLSENTGGVDPFFVIRPHKKGTNKSGYVAAIPNEKKPRKYPNQVNALCALIAETAWEQLRSDPTLLCVHAAAIEINGRLLLIPNKRRAGKSTLTVALAASGYRIFTDDFLPLALNDQGQLCGIANGILPRLRLPLPKGVGAKTAEFVRQFTGPTNSQYKYVKLADNQLAKKGEMLPIGGILVLDRDDGNDLGISTPNKGDVLRVLIKQNFAREMKSGGILRSLEHLAANAKCRELSYAEVGETLDLIGETFAKWTSPVPKFDTDENQHDFHVADLKAAKSNVISFQPNDPLTQSPGVTIRDLGDKKFLSDKNGQAIHQLNETSAAIWQLLDEPTSLDDMTEIFSQAFPNNDAQAMCKDIRKTLKRMSKAGLVQAMGQKNHG